MTPAFSPLQEADWSPVARIYAEGISTGLATFETEVPSWGAWDESHLRDARIVARVDDEVVGWAALTPVSDRCVYGGVAEGSVYVAAGHRGKGIGRALLSRLIAESERAGIWTLQAGIIAKNETSISLCKAAGFRVIGTRERLGEQNGIWEDVVLMERRSTVVGV